MTDLEARIWLDILLYGNCFVAVYEGGVEVLDPATEVVEEPPAAPKEEEKEDVEDIEKRARKPPADGPCKGCGKNKPLNRLFLCYKCWVDKQNSDRGWRPGQPHPAGCGCDLDCRFDDKGAGN